MIKIYLSGRITGNQRYKEEFAEARRWLEQAGYIVLDPSVLPQGMAPRDYMRICFAMIDSADRVAMLPDWEISQGATLERWYAMYCGKLVGEYRGPLGERVNEDKNEEKSAPSSRWIEVYDELPEEMRNVLVRYIDELGNDRIGEGFLRSSKDGTWCVYGRKAQVYAWTELP